VSPDTDDLFEADPRHAAPALSEEPDAAEYARLSVAIEPLALQEEYVRLPSDMAHWGARYARAFKAWKLAALAEERVEAELHLEHRERLAMLGGGEGKKGPTVDAVKSAVVNDQRYHDAHYRTIEAEVEKLRVQGTLEAVRAKREMLVSLGAQLRAEMQSDPRVRADVQAAGYARRGE
jgi:hypothetical protein